MARVVLVSGASSGLGQACARELAARGDTVFGTSRSPRDDDGGVAMLAMDVDDDDSVAARSRPWSSAAVASTRS
ncbi:MAG: hypothetical protein U0168_27335 [Nannocystaceae bacterium]